MMLEKLSGPGSKWILGLLVGVAMGLAVVAYYIWLA